MGSSNLKPKQYLLFQSTIEIEICQAGCKNSMRKITCVQMKYSLLLDVPLELDTNNFRNCGLMRKTGSDIMSLVF